MYNCTVDVCIKLWVNFTLSILNVVMCMVAVALIIYYKFYRSVNYRLLLYLFISLLIYAIVQLLESVFFVITVSFATYIECINIILTAELYAFWNMQLCTAFMAGQIVIVVVFSTELRKAEIPLTLACFVLPLGALVRLRFNDSADYRYYAILGMTAAGVCIVTIATALLCLAYRSLPGRIVSNSNGEEERLLREHTRQRYWNRFKGTFPLIVYSSIILYWVLLLNILRYTGQFSNITLAYVFFEIDSTIGTIVSIVFFIHMKIIGQGQRNAYRWNISPNMEPINSEQEINEGRRTTTSRGKLITTCATLLDALADSDEEP